MKICSLHIRGFQQFQHLDLDFTHPETGEPLDKICFIGKNGTGKSTLLNLVNGIFGQKSPVIKLNESRFYLYAKVYRDNRFEFIFIIHKNIINESSEPGISFFIIQEEDFKLIKSWIDVRINNEYTGYTPSILLRNDSFSQKINRSEEIFTDLLVYQPSESTQNQYVSISDVPETNLSTAIGLFQNFPTYHEISQNTITQFWNTLIYNLKKREQEKNEFEESPENLEKTKRQLLEDFDRKHPKILEEIGTLWNRILAPCGLAFDVEGASNPIQLNDNLKAYVTIKATGKPLNYNQLSTGIRNFMFRLGHLRSLYFNREIDRGLLLVDEPENSLFPDFLYGLVDLYQFQCRDKREQNNTQAFFSTHSPIIAAQFEPYERIVLEWEEDGTVSAHRGVAPLDDDPNDLLKKDFAVRSLMGIKGQQKFEEYRKLKRQLREEKDPETKEKLLKQIFAISKEYEFD